MKAIDRLYIYLDYKGVRPTKFESQAGLSAGYLSKMKSRNADMGESQLNIVLDNCPDLDEAWFVTGRGEMLKNREVSTPSIVNDPQQGYNTSSEIISLQREMIEKSNRIIDQLDEIMKLKEELATLKNAGGVANRIA